jgi:hypothetical protein
MADAAQRQAGHRVVDSAHGDRYKWIVLSNTTLGMLMATIDIPISFAAYTSTPFRLPTASISCG